jgi:hypothetical protein
MTSKGHGYPERLSNLVIPGPSAASSAMEPGIGEVAHLSALSANCPRTLSPFVHFLQVTESMNEIRPARLASHLLDRWRGRIGETLRQGTEKA